MSSLLNGFNNRHLVTATASHIIMAASFVMVLYVLTEGWLW